MRYWLSCGKWLAHTFMANNENLLCIVHYYSKFLVVKKVESMPAEYLI